MSTIKVSKPHELSRDEAKARLATFEESIKKYGVKLVWKGDRADLKGTGVSGGAVVRDDSVEITVKLGLIAKAAGVDAGKLKGSLSRRLEEALAGEAGG